jgi:uncharacterized protein (TIGR03382 family)
MRSSLVPALLLSVACLAVPPAAEASPIGATDGEVARGDAALRNTLFTDLGYGLDHGFGAGFRWSARNADTFRRLALIDQGGLSNQQGRFASAFFPRFDNDGRSFPGRGHAWGSNPFLAGNGRPPVKVVQVPGPPTLTLLAAGLAVLLFRRRAEPRR